MVPAFGIRGSKKDSEAVPADIRGLGASLSDRNRTIELVVSFNWHHGRDVAQVAPVPFETRTAASAILDAISREETANRGGKRFHRGNRIRANEAGPRSRRNQR